jgi:hypothetical protein
VVLRIETPTKGPTGIEPNGRCDLWPMAAGLSLVWTVPRSATEFCDKKQNAVKQDFF